MKRVVVMGLALALAGCGGQSGQENSGQEDSATKADAAPSPTDQPPVAYAKCRACHTVEAGRNMIGPSLHGIVGKRAAAVPGYTYSNALKASGLTWDEKTLDAWLEKPSKVVPGNKMMFMGEADPAMRKQVIDYLARQK